MNFDKDYWKLLSGLAEDDELEDIKEHVSEIQRKNLKRDIQEESFRTKVSLLNEYVGYKPDPHEKGELDSQYSQHPKEPKGWLFADEDADDPEKYEKKLKDKEEYDHAIKIGQTKVRDEVEKFDEAFFGMVSKYSLTEDYKEQPVLPGEMYPEREEMERDDPSKTLIHITPELVDALSGWSQGQGSAINVVMSTGMKGVPASYVRDAIEELEQYPGSGEAQEIVMELDGLLKRAGASGENEFSELEEPHSLIKKRRDDISIKKNEEDLDELDVLHEDDLTESVDVVALYINEELAAVSDSPYATNRSFWDHLISEGDRWELRYLNSLSMETANKLKEGRFQKEELIEAMIASGDQIDSNEDEMDLELSDEELLDLDAHMDALENPGHGFWQHHQDPLETIDIEDEIQSFNKEKNQSI